MPAEKMFSWPYKIPLIKEKPTVLRMSDIETRFKEIKVLKNAIIVLHTLPYLILKLLCLF